MIITQVTNKVLIFFFLPKEILLDTNTFLISTEKEFYGVKFIFPFQYPQMLNFLYAFLYVIINTYVL